MRKLLLIVALVGSMGLIGAGCNEQSLVRDDGIPVDEATAGPRSPHSLAASDVSVPSRAEIDEAPPIAPPPAYPPPLPAGGVNGDRPERPVPGL